MIALLSQIPAHIRRQVQHAAAGVAVTALVLIPGMLFYKSSVTTMSRSSSSEQASMLRSRLMTLRQQLVTESVLSDSELWRKENSNGSLRLRRELPFDLVLTMDEQRKVIDGFRLLSPNKTSVDLTQVAAQHLIPADTGFFDQILTQSSASGLIVIEGRPMLIAVRKGFVFPKSRSLGFIVVGQWLDSRRLASSGEQGDTKIELYSLASDDQLPPDVRRAVVPAQNSNGVTYVADRRGEGFVFSLIDDIGARSALIAKIPWSLPWSGIGRTAFELYYSFSFIAGFCTWSLLFFADRKNRKRVRRFDGLESLKEEHVATLVEAFPGYAFAVKASLEYVGVSRILAGVTAQEPSYFKGQTFGSIAHERNDGTLAKTFESLRDPKRWPRVANINHIIEGLGERHVFHGTAHYLSKQDILLVILGQKENPVTISAPGSHVVSIVELTSEKNSSKNSAVA